MTRAITSPSGTGAVGFACELAELLLEVDSAQTQSARLARDAAREDFLAESERQVAELHDAADATLLGAFAGAAFTIAGSAFEASAACASFEASSSQAHAASYGEHPLACDLPSVTELKLDAALASKTAGIESAWGQGFLGSAGFAKTALGDWQAATDTANAKYAETSAEKAKWVAADASEQVSRVSRLEDKLLEAVQGINQDQNSSNNAVIGRI